MIERRMNLKELMCTTGTDKVGLASHLHVSPFLIDLLCIRGVPIYSPIHNLIWNYCTSGLSEEELSVLTNTLNLCIIENNITLGEGKTQIANEKQNSTSDDNPMQQKIDELWPNDVDITQEKPRKVRCHNIVIKRKDNEDGKES